MQEECFSSFTDLRAIQISFSVELRMKKVLLPRGLVLLTVEFQFVSIGLAH